MTTGQYPKRRETDAQAQRRVEKLEQRRKEQMEITDTLTRSDRRRFLKLLSKKERKELL